MRYQERSNKHNWMLWVYKKTLVLLKSLPVNQEIACAARDFVNVTREHIQALTKRLELRTPEAKAEEERIFDARYACSLKLAKLAGFSLNYVKVEPYRRERLHQDKLRQLAHKIMLRAQHTQQDAVNLYEKAAISTPGRSAQYIRKAEKLETQAAHDAAMAEELWARHEHESCLETLRLFNAVLTNVIHDGKQELTDLELDRLRELSKAEFQEAAR